MKDLSVIPYPAFVIVYGPSKDYISKFNRSTYSEIFHAQRCETEDEVKNLYFNYEGSIDDLIIYAIPEQTVIEV